VHELEVFVLDERRVVSTPHQLAEAIASRIEGGTHLQISSVTSPYPMIDLLVRDPYAVIHYWSHEGVAGDQADSRVADPPEEVEFPHSSLGDTITMPGSVLVDVRTAVVCVEQFAQTLSRPTIVDWTEL
jgi:hypothetical protein